ncbi:MULTISPECIES: hypothetical protein [unclassified Yoonia]|uniref:hypothetical protein n=1 Tax=unclassified Yoonia TaxID=2629118 RepID=UPI002AFFA255|nr:MULTISPECIES: hypothetical protein [unclassified Yoonia]
MKYAILHSATTAVFVLMLTGIYALEISVNWSYLGFTPLGSTFAILTAAIICCLYSLVLSGKQDLRNLTHVMMHYVFFVPSMIVSTTDGASDYYFLLLMLSYTLILIFSRVPIRLIRTFYMEKKQYFYLVLCAMIVSVLLLAAYGGLQRFNLNIFAVYDFRRNSALAMPAIFAYFYSGVAKVIAPMTIALAIYFRSFLLAIVATVLTVLMFGMTHHKSVLFLPLIVAAIYLFLQSRQAAGYLAAGFVFVVFLSAVELLVISAGEGEGVATYTSIVIRRIFFVPPLLDTTYINYFFDAPKILWSTSRFGFGLAENPYDLTAPFLIGADVFGQEGMSANTGVIGSGFSHAGIVGAIIYSIFLGLIVSSLNSFGNKIGHRLVFASSISILMSVLTSTDLTTAVLTHGLLLLFVLLMIFPRAELRTQESIEVST